MGTSMSSLGPKSNSPLLPPWAAPVDDSGSSADTGGKDNSNDATNQPVETQNPLTLPSTGSRFSGFRSHFGSFMNSGNTSDARKALKSYARTSSGGGSTAKQRMSPTTNTGASLINFFNGHSSLSTNRDGTIRDIKLSDLNGKSVDYVIDEITTALVPENGDSEKIRNALNESLSEALIDVEVFDEANITPDVLTNMLVVYLAESIFNQIALEAGEQWKKAPSLNAKIRAEEDLRDIIQSVVEVRMLDRIIDDITTFSVADIKDLQDDTIGDVWEEWGEYNGND